MPRAKLEEEDICVRREENGFILITICSKWHNGFVHVI